MFNQFTLFQNRALFRKCHKIYIFNLLEYLFIQYSKHYVEPSVYGQEDSPMVNLWKGKKVKSWYAVESFNGTQQGT